MKPEAKVLRYMIAAAQVAQKARDPRERRAALDLEIELTERLAALEKKPANQSEAHALAPAHAA